RQLVSAHASRRCGPCCRQRPKVENVVGLSSMHGIQRLVSAALLLVFASLVTGCSSINVPSWDPTDLLDFLDTKKRAVGEQKPVFPDGVPGVRQGVPAEYVRGTPEHQAAMAAGDPTLAPPQVVEAPPEPAKPQKKRVGSKPVTVTPNQS